jgi:hypothetical protein
VKPGPAGSVEMVASRDISAEEDLLLSYGMLDNTFLLLDYGAAQPRERLFSLECSSAKTFACMAEEEV